MHLSFLKKGFSSWQSRVRANQSHVLQHDKNGALRSGLLPLNAIHRRFVMILPDRMPATISLSL